VPVAQMLTGAYLGKKGDEESLKLAQKLRQDQQQELENYIKLHQGVPATYGADIPTETYETVKGQMLTPAVPANPQAANMYGLKTMHNPELKQIALKNMIAPPEEVTLPEGAVRFIKNPDNTYKQVATGGEKLHTVKGNLVTSSGKVVYSAPAEAGEGFGIGGLNVNNNGMRVGKYDKMGRYISPTGQVYPASAVTEARAEHDAATDLAYKLNQLNKQDVNNAYGSLTDYTTSKVGRMAGPTSTLDAQTKINNIGINNTLNNLSRLKGASSDKEMAQMIKDFPGYEAPPSVMNSWVERASKTTNRFLKRSENRFGFDTEYAEEGRFGEKPKEQKGEIAALGAPKVGEIRQGYRFKGGDQYNQTNWEKVK
jgi:flagellar hook-associated protein FlgK